MIFLNWKANGDKSLIDEFNGLSLGKNVVLMPPHHLLGLASGKYSCGAQSVSRFKSGPYTGEVTAEMLADIGVKYCLVGHSERRKYGNDADDTIAVQIANLLNSGIVPVLCIGESLEERKQNVYFDKLKDQLSVWKKGCIVAYEPVWSIGTGVLPTQREIVEASNFIRQTCSGVKVLYGGSVSSSNITEIKLAGVDGVLVGGASLKRDEVIQMTAAWE